METNLPRKEAVRVLLDVLNGHRKAFAADYNGHHRDVATGIVDKCEKITDVSPYATRFMIDGNTLFATVKRTPVAFIDLNAFDAFLASGAKWGATWTTNVGAYDWVPVKSYTRKG